MIIGLGLDIIELERMKSVSDKWGDKFADRIFTVKELEHWRAGGLAASRLAGRFAAKEAAMKALGVGWGASATWHDFEIVNNKLGKPVLSMAGSAARTAEELGVKNIHVSISHSEKSACAVVILESS